MIEASHMTAQARFAQNWTPEANQDLLDKIERAYPGQLEFRVSEAPFFVDDSLYTQLLEAGEYICEWLERDDLIALTEPALPPHQRVPGEPAHPQFLALDYALCPAEGGGLRPRMIELQAFPSLFAFQDYFSRVQKEVYAEGLSGYTHMARGLTRERYLTLLREAVCGQHAPEDVILLEIEPERQKTRIDFACTYELLGVEPVCLSDVEAEGDRLYYQHPTLGRRQIRRIYNRVIFDELDRMGEEGSTFRPGFDLSKPYQVEWAGHPGWYFRVSKFLLPFLEHPSVPRTRRLLDFDQDPEGIPLDLSKYVLKPLFSFSGQGVIFNVTSEDVRAITDREGYVLQEKVTYAPALHTPEGAPVKVELRLLYLWPDGHKSPTLCTNLIRLSQGDMIGVRFNKDKTWVGGNTAYWAG